MTTSLALQKLRKYCAYQERSPFEVYRKLGSLGLPKERQEEVVASLMEENFLDEFRFAEAFCQGKLNQKHWAPYRISIGLREHRIPKVTVDHVIAQIPQKKVEENAFYLVERWFQSKTRNKLFGAMQRRGYSLEMISRVYDIIKDGYNQ
jgi:regulatory protein